MSKHANLGKKAEKQVQAWLEARSAAGVAFAFHRFPDARAARGMLAAQPSDYLVAHRGRMVLLEVKETQQERRLPKAKVSQYGALLKFYLAGSDVIVLVYRSTTSDWVYLDADNLFDNAECPPSFPLYNLPAFASASDALEEIFR